MGNLDTVLLNKIRIRTIDLVLSTDLTKHFKILEHWKSCFDQNGQISIQDEDSRGTMMKMIIKFSDIANPAKEYESHKKWSKRLQKELFQENF